MIVEVRPAGAERLLVTLDLPAPRARLKKEADAALEEMARLHLAGGVKQADDGAVEVVFIQPKRPRRDGGSAPTVDRILGHVVRVTGVVNQDKLVEQRL